MLPLDRGGSLFTIMINHFSRATHLWRQQVPNALSLLRACLALVFPLVDPSWRLTLICVAAMSEFFDGFLARRWHAVSPLGQILDPVADKLFILSTVFVLISDGSLTVLQLILISARDIIVAVGTISVFAER